MTTMIRPRKDGGYSECSSPDELVGKGRCCHILGDEGGSAMELRKLQRGMYEVQIENQPSSITIQSQKETIMEFFSNLGKLKGEQVERIVNFLNMEG